MGIDYRRLGKNIKFYRKQKKLTQEQLAEKIDLSVGFIGQIERGVTKMSLDTLIDICESLDCSAGDLLDHSQEIHSSIMYDDFYTLYEKLPKREQNLFYYMLKAYLEHL